MFWKELLVFLTSGEIREGKEKKKIHFVLVCYCKTEIQLPGQFFSEMQGMISSQPPLSSAAFESLVSHLCWSSEAAVVRPALRKAKAVFWLFPMVQAGCELQFCINSNRDLLVDSVTLCLKSWLLVQLVLSGQTLVG